MSDWISVEDDLPKYGVRVIVDRPRRELCIARRTHTDLTGEHWNCDYYHDIVDWMYLPETRRSYTSVNQEVDDAKDDSR